MPRIPGSSLSYCLVDGHAIFLDIDADRYFRLEAGREVEFLASGAREAMQADIPQPGRSALELAADAGSAGLVAVLKAFAITLRMRHRLRAWPLQHVLGSVVRLRDAARLPADEARLVQLSGRFLRARLYVPVEPSCLLDSLALTAYLAARGLHASIVFGVTDAPFSAHCWVQAGDLVLNDTVGNAMAYVPIRVV